MREDEAVAKPRHDALPTGLRLFAVAPEEPDLGWDRSTPEQVRQLVAVLPFEHAMLVLAQLEAAHWHVRNDAAGQLVLARSFFGTQAPVVGHLERGWPRRSPASHASCLTTDTSRSCGCS